MDGVRRVHSQIVVDAPDHVFKPSRRREAALSGVTPDIIGLDPSHPGVFKSRACVDKVIDEIPDLVKAEAILAQTVLQ